MKKWLRITKENIRKDNRKMALMDIKTYFKIFYWYLVKKQISQQNNESIKSKLYGDLV